MSETKLKIAVIGTGPAGLMTATRLSLDPRFEIHLFEKRKALGRKLLIAGSSGLNISHHASPEAFAGHYSGWNQTFWLKLFHDFKPADWIHFIEEELKLETFLGTSDRYFVREMKASGLLKRWTELLQLRGVQIHSQHELVDFKNEGQQVVLSFKDQLNAQAFDRVALLMGGGSWLGDEGLEPNWAEVLRRKELKIVDFQASNVGYEVKWSEGFLKEAEGQPLKKVLFTSSQGAKLGELMITAYGLEGTPVYFLGQPGKAYLDLKPDLTREQIEAKCSAIRENLSPIRRVKKVLALSDVALALLFHHTREETRQSLPKLIDAIKKFELNLLGPRPLSESISSKGGVSLTEVTEALELRRFKHVYCGGEMLDWDAPTGGFLIQASISQGDRVAESIIASIESSGGQGRPQ